MLAGELPYAAIAQRLDFLLIEVSEGKAEHRASLTPGVQRVRAEGTVLHWGGAVNWPPPKPGWWARMARMYAHATTTGLVFDQPA